jgi:fatty-acyl-CoA synthase
MDLVGMLAEPARRASLETQSLVALVRAGVVGVELPHRMLQIVQALNDYGPFGGAPRIAAIRHGDHAAVTDERGEITFKELDDRVNRLANALLAEGVPQGASVGILCRNHRQPLIAAFAASRAGPQRRLAEHRVLRAPGQGGRRARGRRHPRPRRRVHRAGRRHHEPRHGKRRVDITDTSGDELDALIEKGDDKPPPASPKKPGKIVLLTSGTTGTPKGAPRAEPRSLALPGALLERMPMKAREADVIGPPLYHGTGLIIALLSLALGSTLVLRRKFDAAQFLDDIEEQRATTSASCR